MEETDNKQQYKSVLKSTSMIGGSAFFNILIGMIRTKFVAILLGPDGVGLQNMYHTIITTISTITSLGLNSSGVRSIAEANGQNDSERVARIVKTIRSTVWISGIVGTLLVILLSGYISEFTFKTQEHRIPLMLLSVIVLLTNIQVGQTCILQGLRKISNIAKISIWGAVNGTLISIPCFYLWGKEGIVPSLILTAVAALTTSWLYARKIEVTSIEISRIDKNTELKELLSYGLPQMLTGMMSSLSAYFMRFIIISLFGLTGVGIWSAAFNISGVLTNFVLNAMITDYYPRLAAISKDFEKINKEVNTQLEIALLLACPALIVTILFAPLGIRLLYSGRFDEAIPVLRWSVYGILGRVVCWPLGVIIPAQGRGKLLIVVEIFGHLINLALTYYLSVYYGLPGTGLAMALNYIIYFFIISFIANKIAKTSIEYGNIRLISFVLIACIISSLISSYVLNELYCYSLSVLFTTTVVFYVFRRLKSKTGINFETVLNKFKSKFMGK